MGALGNAVGHVRQQVGVNDQDLGAAVTQDIARLVGLEMPVHRHRVGAGRRGRHRSLKKGQIVPQDQRDGIVVADSQRPEPASGLGDPPFQGRLADLTLTTDNHAIHTFRLTKPIVVPLSQW